jgi:hypothetical protein
VGCWTQPLNLQDARRQARTAAPLVQAYVGRVATFFAGLCPR